MMKFLRTFYIRSRGLLKAIVLFLGVSLVALGITLSQLDLESLRDDILSALRGASNLPVEIDGKISWNFSLRPEIKLNSVRVPNAKWAKDKNLFFADKIEVRLDLISLLRSRPVIRRIKVYNAKVSLEKNNKGENSIVFNNKPTEEDNKENKKEEVSKRGKYPVDELPFGGLEFTKLTANIYGEKYVVNGLGIHNHIKDNNLEFSGWIRPNKKAITCIVDFSEYNSERKVYPVKIALSTGGEALTANIALEGTSKLPIDFIVRGDLPEIKKYGNLFDVDTSKDTNIKLNIVGGLDGKKLSLRKSSITSGDSSVVISGIYDWSGKSPVVNMDITSDKFDLYKSGAFGGDDPEPDRELNCFKDMPLYGQYLYNADVKLNLNLKNFIVYRSLAIKDFKVNLNLKNNKLRTDIHGVFAGGNVNAALESTLNKEGVFDAQAAVRGEHIYIGNILTEIYIKNIISQLPMNMDVYVRAKGTDMSQIMQTITGHVIAYSVDHGYAHERLVEYMYGGDFLTTLRNGVEDMFTGNKHDMIEISKAIANVKIRDGLIETEKGVAVESHVINLRLSGDLDLGKETIKLSLATVPVRGLKLSLSSSLVNAVQISGNLAEPDIKISGEAIMGKVGSTVGLGLLFSPLTGGLSLLAGFVAGDLLESWLADEHPYDTAMKDGAPSKKDDPRWLNMPVEVLTQPMLQKKSK